MWVAEKVTQQSGLTGRSEPVIRSTEEPGPRTSPHSPLCSTYNVSKWGLAWSLLQRGFLLGRHAHLLFM